MTKLVNFCSLTNKFKRLMFTRPKSTLHICKSCEYHHHHHHHQQQQQVIVAVVIIHIIIIIIALLLFVVIFFFIIIIIISKHRWQSSRLPAFHVSAHARAFVLLPIRDTQRTSAELAQITPMPTSSVIVIWFLLHQSSTFFCNEWFRCQNICFIRNKCRQRKTHKRQRDRDRWRERERETNVTHRITCVQLLHFVLAIIVVLFLVRLFSVVLCRGWFRCQEQWRLWGGGFPTDFCCAIAVDASASCRTLSVRSAKLPNFTTIPRSQLFQSVALLSLPTAFTSIWTYSLYAMIPRLPYRFLTPTENRQTWLKKSATTDRETEVRKTVSYLLNPVIVVIVVVSNS